MSTPVVVSTARTPMGRAFKGALRDERPDDMLAQVVGQALGKVPSLDPASVDDMMIGCGSPAGVQGFNIARVAGVQLGLDGVPGTTVNRYCASSIQTVRMASHAVWSGEGDVFVAGGVESCSSYAAGDADTFPDSMNSLFDPAVSRTAERSEGSSTSWTDPRSSGELPDIYIEMGQTAENVAQLCDVPRADMDEFALLSQSRTAAAMKSGFWAKDIEPYRTSEGVLVEYDESPRPQSSAEGLAALAPAFRPGGTVTAGNSCPLSDGASAAVIMSDTRAADLGIQPLARIISTGVSGISPEVMGLGPIEASQRALRLANMTIADIDLIEINEAFAAMILPTVRALSIDVDRLNVNGGAIAIGHPFGSTGTRLLNTMINSLRERDRHMGLITLCAAGGQGMALVVERLA